MNLMKIREIKRTHLMKIKLSAFRLFGVVVLLAIILIACYSRQREREFRLTPLTIRKMRQRDQAKFSTQQNKMVDEEIEKYERQELRIAFRQAAL